MFYDVTTSLPSKKAFEDFASKMWSSAKDTRFAILSINIEYQNEDFQANSPVSDFVQKVIRTHDYMLSACYAKADSFYILLDLELIDQNQLVSILERDLQGYFTYVQKMYSPKTLHLCGGICILSENIPSIKKALEYSLYAENTVKNSNSLKKISIGFYREALGNCQQENRVLPLFENLMSDHHLVIYLQPFFKLGQSLPIGGEALVRIMDVKGHLMKPDDFLQVLQKYHITYQLDLMVIERILKLLSKWKNDGFSLIPVSINLAQGDFISENFMQIFTDIAAKYESVIHYLQFEIASNDFYSHIAYMMPAIDKLHQLGCQIKLDGFGGDELLLRSLEIPCVDMIKFHRDFMLTGMKGTKNLQIIKKMAEMFTECNIDVLCEGIESVKEEDFVRSCNISYVQGFYYERPIPFDIFQKKYLMPQLSHLCLYK